MKRFGKVLVLTLSIIGLSLILGIATSHEVRAAVTALVTVANTSANPVPAQSVDAKNAYQVRVVVGMDLLGNFRPPQVLTIPAGQRLVVDFVTAHGFAPPPAGAAVQPEIILESSLNGGGQVSYLLLPAPTPFVLPGSGAGYLAQPVKIYADNLTVAASLVGATPLAYSFDVSISGHLVPIP
jgi:hypothetical protein